MYSGGEPPLWLSDAHHATVAGCKRVGNKLSRQTGFKSHRARGNVSQKYCLYLANTKYHLKYNNNPNTYNKLELVMDN